VELHLRNLTIEEGNVSNITAEIFVGTKPSLLVSEHIITHTDQALYS